MSGSRKERNSSKKKKNPNGVPPKISQTTGSDKFRNRVMGLDSSQSAKLREKIKKSREVEHLGCMIAPSISRYPAAYQLDTFRRWAALLMTHLVDSHHFIPIQAGVNYAVMYFYVIKAWQWHSYKCGMTSKVPNFDFDNLAIPGWMAIFFRSNSPYRRAGVSITFESLLDDEAVAAISQPQGDVTNWDFRSPVRTGTSSGEEAFGAGVNITAVDASQYFPQLSLLIADLKHKVLVKDVPKQTSSSECYWDTAGYTLGKSSAMAVAQAIYVTNFACEGILMPAWSLDHKAYAGWVFQGCALEDGKSITWIAKSLGYDPMMFTVAREFVNLAWVNLAVVDFLIVNKDRIDPAGFWKLYRAYYVSVLTYLFSFAPLPVRARLCTNLNATCYSHPDYRGTPIHTTFAMMQKPGVYKNLGGIVLLCPTISGLASHWNLATITTLSYYNGSQGSFDSWYMAGAVDWALTYDIPVGGFNFNYLPLGHLAEFQQSVLDSPLVVFSNRNPGLQKCLCFARVEAISDYDYVGAVEIHYWGIQALFCNHKMDKVSCCWMYAGCIAQLAFDRITHYTQGLGDRSNKLRALSRASTIRGATETAVGQSRNVSAAYTAVTKDQYMGTMTKTVEVLTGNDVRELVSMYASTYTEKPGPPSWEDLVAVVTGELALEKAVSTIAAGVAAYGPDVYKMYKSLRVRTEM